MQQLQPDAPARKEKPSVNATEAPESTFKFEKQKLEQLAEKLEKEDFPTRLGLYLTATPAEARLALRQKTKEFHPDDKPDELKEVYSKIFALYTQASNAFTEGATKKSRIESMPTPLEEFRKAFQMYRTMDAAHNIPPRETFNMVKKIYLKKGTITEADVEQLEAVLLAA